MISDFSLLTSFMRPSVPRVDLAILTYTHTNVSLDVRRSGCCIFDFCICVWNVWFRVPPMQRGLSGAIGIWFVGPDPRPLLRSWSCLYAGQEACALVDEEVSWFPSGTATNSTDRLHLLCERGMLVWCHHLRQDRFMLIGSIFIFTIAIIIIIIIVNGTLMFCYSEFLNGTLMLC